MTTKEDLKTILHYTKTKGFTIKNFAQLFPLFPVFGQDLRKTLDKVIIDEYHVLFIKLKNRTILCNKEMINNKNFFE